MEERFNIPITLIDERLSTVMAGAHLKASGKNSKQARKEIDQIAAVGILEQGLAIERQAEGRT
jgi:putative Holliday junction resolvase